VDECKLLVSGQAGAAGGGGERSGAVSNDGKAVQVGYQTHVESAWD
jgi:hypothetical protein